MKPLSEFFPRVLPYLPACPKPLAEQMLLDSAIAFCTQSDFVRESLDVQRTTAGIASYELELPAQQEVARVLRVVVGDRELTALPSAGSHPTDARTAPPACYYTTRNESALEIRLYPTPDRAYPLAVEVSLRPARSAVSLQEDLWDLWLEPIAAGAIARAMMVPGQPFTDHALAQMYAAQAQAGINKARREGIAGRLKGSLSVRMRAFS